MQRLLYFGILALLPEVLCYVAQLPRTIVESVQVLRVTAPNDSLSTVLDG